MATSTGAKKKSVQLKHGEKDSWVVICPQNEDRFVISMDTAIKACNAWNAVDQFKRQLWETLLPALGKWIESQRTKIMRAFVTLREGGLLFLVVQGQAQYDEDFEDALTEIDIRVANSPDLNIINLDVLVLPHVSDEAIDSFIDPQLTIEYKLHA